MEERKPGPDLIRMARSSVGAIKFTERLFERPRYTLLVEHALVQTGPGLSKIVVHVIRPSENDKVKISRAIHAATRELNLSGANASAGDNPVMRGNWDYVLFHVPDLRAGAAMTHILGALESALS